MRTTFTFAALGAFTFLACSSNSPTEAPPDEEVVGSDAAPGSGGATGVGGAGGHDASAGGSGGVRADAAVDATPTKAWDWAGVIGTGQSLSVGAQAGTPTLTTQPFNNLKLALNGASVTVPPYDANDPALSVVALVETIRDEASGYPSAYPLNIYGETPHTAMADQISELYKKATSGDYVTVHTVVGESGQGMSVINKTAKPTANLGHAYAATLFEVTALERLAKAAGKTYGVGGIILTHGETDGGNANYERDMYKLYTDYNTDIAAITGQTTKIPLFTTQQQTCPGDNSTTASLIAEWKIGVDHPGEVVCVGPKYQYEYFGDHLHLVANGYDQLGEKYGEVYYQKVVLGLDWQPLQPLSAVLAGSAITVQFHVPVPPLAWDADLPAPHQSAHTAWTNGKGFEVANTAGEQTISSVAIQGESVVITLASAPSTAGLVVRYAVTQDGSGNQGGLETGRIGLLRDSDPLIGYATNLPQYNFAVSFSVPVK
jgi:hypothetical protein